jgi:hypothetical protein
VSAPGDALVNLTTYTPLQIAFFALGGAGWVVAYVMVLVNIRKHGVVEIPVAAVACNMAWETTWGLIYRTDLGVIFVWGYRTWFVLDLFIFGFLFLNGAKHLKTPLLREWFKPGLVASYVAWLIMLYLFVKGGYDTPTGLTTGFIATILMSALYLLVELSNIAPSQYSRVVAWAKLLGNGFASVFCVMVYPDRHFLLVICALTFVLDVVYLIMFRNRRLGSPMPLPA